MQVTGLGVLRELNRWQILIAALVILNITFLCVGKLSVEIAFSSILVPLLLLSISDKEHQPGTSLSLSIIGLMGALGASFFLSPILVRNLANPPEWDFLCFWANGSVAAAGKNFYFPASYADLELPMAASEEFVREIINVGFHFPTPSMFLYMPLTYLDFTSAYFLWLCLQSIAFIAVSYSLTKRFCAKINIKSFGALIALFLLLGASRETFAHAQTNFFILLCFMTYLAYPRTLIAGAALAVGVIFKPIVAIILLLSVIKRDLSTIIGFLSAVIVAFLLSYFVFGSEIVASYFFADIPGRVPSHMYTQDLNQSLLSVVLRVFVPNPFPAQAIFYLPFVVVAGSLTAVTCYRVMKMKEEQQLLAFSYILVLALICYPGTLTHYNAMLIVPILTIWLLQQKKEGIQWLTLFSLTLVVILTQFSNWLPNHLALLLTWGLLTFESFAKYEKLERA